MTIIEAAGFTNTPSGNKFVDICGNGQFMVARVLPRRIPCVVIHCAECDYDYDLNLAADTSTVATRYAVEYAKLLRAEPSVLRRRATPQVWSPLEYACHVRDVMLIQRERLLAARRSDAPSVEPMGRDERVEHDGYAQQQPANVARQLQDATLLFTHSLDRLGPGDWERTLTVPYPATAVRSLRWFAVHTVHELRHHLLDIRRQLETR